MRGDTEIDELIESIAADDLDRSHALLQRIWERRPSFEECCCLLDLLDDDYDDVGTMYGIVHAMERALPDVMYRAIAIKLPTLLHRSPEWAGSLIARNLAAIEGQSSGHSAKRFLNVVAQQVDAKCLDVIRHVYHELNRKGELKQVISHPALI